MSDEQTFATATAFLFPIAGVRQLLEQTATGPDSHVAVPRDAAGYGASADDGRHLRLDMDAGVRLRASNHNQESAPEVFAEGFDPVVNRRWRSAARTAIGAPRVTEHIMAALVEQGLREADAEGRTVTHLAFRHDAGDSVWDLVRLSGEEGTPARKRPRRPAAR